MNYKLKILSKLALVVGVLFLSACDELAGLDPIIANFSADPSSISAGEETTLSWSIIGGETDAKAVLTPGDVEVEKMGSLAVTPSETTTYTLSAGTSTKSLEVVVEGTGDADTGDDDTGNDDAQDDTGSDDGMDDGGDTGADDGGTDDGGTDDGGTDDGGTEDGGADDGGTDGGEVACDDGQAVDIPDPLLLAALQSELETETITCDQLASAVVLELGDGDPEVPESTISNLEGLQYATNLESLLLVQTGNDTSLEPISGLEKLSSVSFEFGRPDDLSSLSKLPNLRSFAATGANNTDFSSLDATNLTSISVQGFSEGAVGVKTLNLNDFAAAKDLTNLTIANVFVENQQVLANFTKMVGISYRPAISDGTGATFIDEAISAISTYTNIDNLTYEPTLVVPVEQEPVVIDFSPWANLTTLTILNINVTNDGLFKVKDLEFTANFNDLYLLSLRNAGISDITPLINLPWPVPIESSADLTGNPDIPAEQIEALREKTGVVIEE